MPNQGYLKPSDIPADFEVQPLKVGQTVPSGGVHATCGTCGLSWDDSVSTSWTPTPSARCPFEYFHNPPRKLKVSKTKPETYKQAQQRLLSELLTHGWTTSPLLKTPWAKKGELRLNFHPQAVYLDQHSLFLDIRGMTVDSFLKRVEVVDFVQGSYIHSDKQSCQQAGSHLTSCDNDGFCNHCGEQGA